VFNSCLRSTLIFYLEKTGASLNFKTDLWSLHISPAGKYV
jgi:hypothetical protein